MDIKKSPQALEVLRGELPTDHVCCLGGVDYNSFMRIFASPYSLITHRKMARKNKPNMKLGVVPMASSILYPSQRNRKDAVTMANPQADIIRMPLIFWYCR
jgi:hypothetical protein